MGRASASLVCIAIAACGYRPLHVAVGSLANSDAIGVPIEWKEVATKNAPHDLVAGDGSVCRVSEERFEGTQPGELVRRAWRWLSEAGG